MFGTRFGPHVLAGLALFSMTSLARAGDEPEPPIACSDADVEELDAAIHCDGGQWHLTGSYDVEIEDPTSGAEFDLILTLVDCNSIPSKECSDLVCERLPLTRMAALDADDDDEIEFEDSFAMCLEGDFSINCDRLRLHAVVVERCKENVLDEEEDKVVVRDPGSCAGPEVAVTMVTDDCDPCSELRVAMDD